LFVLAQQVCTYKQIFITVLSEANNIRCTARTAKPEAKLR